MQHGRFMGRDRNCLGRWNLFWDRAADSCTSAELGHFSCESSRGLGGRTAIAGDGLSGSRPSPFHSMRRLNQRGRLGKDDVGLGLRGRLSTDRVGAGQRLDRHTSKATRPEERTGLADASVRSLWFDGGLDRPGNLDAGLRTPLPWRCLLPALRWPKALTAATAAPPTPGPILKLSPRRLTAGGAPLTGAPLRRGADSSSGLPF